MCLCHPVSPLSSSSGFLVDLASILDLHQLNTVRNKRGVILDLIFSSDSSSVIEPAHDVLIPLEDDHPALAMNIGTESGRSNGKLQLVPDLRRCDLPAVFNYIASLSYPLVDTTNAETLFSHFCDELRNAILMNCPYKKIGTTSFPHWFSTDLKKLIIQKKLSHKRFKETSDPTHYAIFQRLRAQCTVLVSQCRRKLLDRINDSVSNNPKSFWSYVSQQRKTSNIPRTIRHEESVAEDPEEICRVFASYFATIFSKTHEDPPVYHPREFKVLTT
ncbi:MAG: hypothetical protein KFE21_00010 [Candidatus Sulcia muelleri]|nr:hypothetical protein [Candidatus Karelsulcia muelleri]